VPKLGDFLARVVFPVSGQETSGLKVGSAVLVAFGDGDPESPFVLGTYLPAA
jgi:hypothetical protein